MAIKISNYVISGVSISGLGDTTNYLVSKNEDGTVSDASFYYMDGEKGPVQPMCIGLYEDPALYLVREINLAKGNTYAIFGTCAPIDSVVNLTPKSKYTDVETLKDNVIASTQPDDDGSYSFDEITAEENLICWISTSPQNYSLASLDCDAQLIEIEDTNKKILQEKFTASYSAEGPDSIIYMQLNGTCPLDSSEIYISSAVSNTPTRQELLENLMYTGNSTEGKYAIFGTCQNNNDYFVWCETETEEQLSIEQQSFDQYVTECLAAGTLITMADGTTKKIEEISCNDIVLAPNQKCAKVLKTSSKFFYPYHTQYFFDDGTMVDEVSAHRFFNIDQGFYQIMKKWKIGERAVKKDGTTPALISKKIIHEKARQYGIWVEGGCYYANNLLSGQAKCNREYLAEATIDQAVNMALSIGQEWILKLSNVRSDLP